MRHGLDRDPTTCTKYATVCYKDATPSDKDATKAFASVEFPIRPMSPYVPLCPPMSPYVPLSARTSDYLLGIAPDSRMSPLYPP